MRNQNTTNQLGFTVIELLVVFLIMILLASVVIVDWNRQTPNRSLNIAVNELVTNLNKAKSYSISSRNPAAGVLAKYYAVEFVVGDSSYSISGFGGDNYTAYSKLETINLPTGLTISAIGFTSSTGVKTSPDCAVVIYSAVYGKTYITTNNNKGCGNYQTLFTDPVSLAAEANKDMTLTIKHTQKGTTRSIDVFGLTGRIQGN